MVEKPERKVNFNGEGQEMACSALKTRPLAMLPMVAAARRARYRRITI
jgi:hypothetical protein